MIPIVELNKVEPLILEHKYVHFEDLYSALDYIQQMSLIFYDNKKESISLNLFPKYNLVKQIIIQNSIWIADKSISMN